MPTGGSTDSYLWRCGSNDSFFWKYWSTVVRWKRWLTVIMKCVPVSPIRARVRVRVRVKGR